jgi:hypothetical protein
MLVRKRSHVVSLVPKSRFSTSPTSVRYLLQLYLVLFSSAPVVLYAIFVADVTLSLSDENAIGDQGAEALARGLPDSQITVLSLCTLSAAAIFGTFHERPASALL